MNRPGCAGRGCSYLPRGAREEAECAHPRAMVLSVNLPRPGPATPIVRRVPAKNRALVQAELGISDKRFARGRSQPTDLSLRHNLCEGRRQLTGANRWFNVVCEVVWWVSPDGQTGQKEKGQFYQEDARYKIRLLRPTR
jgi:hypothetical protein